MPTMSASYMRDYRARKAVERDGDGLLGFQAAYVRAVCRKESPVDIGALSCPRGSGKSWLCGGLVARSLSPDDELFEAGCENILVSSSRAQAGIVLEFARQALGEADGYRWRNDGATHVETRTRVRVISSDARRALGLGANCRLVVADEPSAWGPNGLRLWSALTGALGKRRMQILVIGTLAPSPAVGAGAWWPEFVAAGSGAGRHVTLLQADPEKWEDFDEVVKCNPVSMISKHLR